MRFSPSTVGFYPEDFPDDVLPADCIEITDELYAELFAAQTQGKVIVAGTDDQPVAIDPVVPPPSLADQAAALLAGGLAVTCTGTPARSATYPCDAATQQEIVAEMVSILANGCFADGESTIQWPDSGGVSHGFDIDGFKALATAIGAFTQPVLRIMRTNVGSLPAATATIP